MSISARAKDVTFGKKHTMRVELADGCSLHVPLAYFPRLSGAKLEMRKKYRIADSGDRLHWGDLGEDISVRRLATMTSLREFMECRLRNWQSSFLPPCWREGIGDVRLNFDALDPATNEDKILCNNAWPRGNNIFEAFRRICPNDVRVVVFGNEPYSKACRSTGRAFEQGDIDSFNDDGAREKITDSLRGLILAVLMTNCSDGKLNGLADCGNLGRQAELFNSWERHGVMWLNISLTFSSKAHGKKHRKLWRPFMAEFIKCLVNRPQNPVVFAAWGDEAQKEVKRALRNLDAREPCVLLNAHPSSYGCKFFADGNPLFAINGKLQNLDIQDIPWWPVTE